MRVGWRVGGATAGSLQIIEYSDANETAVCNLGSISLGKFVDATTRTFDYQKLLEVTRVLTRNLNRVIDINYYPVPEAKRSNLRHRPIGLGVQVGLPLSVPLWQPNPTAANVWTLLCCNTFVCAYPQPCVFAHRALRTLSS